MDLMKKLEKLYMIDDTKHGFGQYVIFRIQEYDSEKDCFQSFDDYVQFCLHMLLEDYNEK